MTTPANPGGAPLASLGERGLIARIRDRFPAPPGLLTVGIGDDAAVAPPVRGALEILTTDALVEGVHFDLAFCAPADVGYKALAVNISDVAAMGGTPRLALLSFMLPSTLTVEDVDELLDGVAAMAAEAGVTLAGGNITASPGPLVIDATLTGSVRPRRVLTRAGGRPGDALYVSGAIGAAAAGLGWLRANPGRTVPDDAGLAECVARYRRPSPRLRLGTILGRSRTAAACMDLSDGLADAVSQLARASGTGARLDAAALPIHEAARQWFVSQAVDPVGACVQGGDDYELLFAVASRHRGRLRGALAQARGVPVTRVGELTAEPDLILLRNGAALPLPEGFRHF